MTCPPRGREHDARLVADEPHHHDLVAVVQLRRSAGPPSSTRCGTPPAASAGRFPCSRADEQVRPAGVSPFAGWSAGVKRASVRHGGDDLHAVAELEELGDRLAVAGAGRHLVDPHRVRGAVVGEEDDVIERAAGHHGDDLVAFADARRSPPTPAGRRA